MRPNSHLTVGLDSDNFGYLNIDTYSANKILGKLLFLIREDTRVENPSFKEYTAINKISRICIQLSNPVFEHGVTMHVVQYLSYEDIEILCSLKLSDIVGLHQALTSVMHRVKHDTTLDIVSIDKMAKDLDVLMTS